MKNSHWSFPTYLVTINGDRYLQKGRDISDAVFGALRRTNLELGLEQTTGIFVRRVKHPKDTPFTVLRRDAEAANYDRRKHG